MNPYITENEEGEHTVVQEPRPVVVERIPATKRRRFYDLDENNAWQWGQDLFEKYHGY